MLYYLNLCVQVECKYPKLDSRSVGHIHPSWCPNSSWRKGSVLPRGDSALPRGHFLHVIAVDSMCTSKQGRQSS